MPLSPLDSRVYGPLFSDPEVNALFSDERRVAAMLRVEGALARAQAEAGLVPPEAAARIADVASKLDVDLDALAAATERAGFPVLGLVEQLRAAAGAHADWVHWGATTQDVLDTALALQLRDALRPIEAHLRGLVARLAALADAHRGTLLAARTHGQQALPTVFGLKAAGWLAPLLRHRARLDELKPRLFVVQCGGAAGTQAAWGAAGPAVQRALARGLGLGEPLNAWHAQRDAVAELGGWLSLVAGSLGKLAQDVILMAQDEVGELREGAAPGRGGSSAMPQKRNPVDSELVLAAARANAALLGALHQAQIQEHERGTHGWQVEWLTLPQMVALTAGALRRARALCEGLAIDADRMRANLDAARGAPLAEALVLALTPHAGRERAQALVREGLEASRAHGTHLVEAVRARSDAPLDWGALADPANYLGSAEAQIDRVLAEAKRVLEG